MPLFNLMLKLVYLELFPAVIGGGIGGTASAYFLRKLIVTSPLDIHVFESSKASSMTNYCSNKLIILLIVRGALHDFSRKVAMLTNALIIIYHSKENLMHGLHNIISFQHELLFFLNFNSF